MNPKTNIKCDHHHRSTMNNTDDSSDDLTDTSSDNSGGGKVDKSKWSIAKGNFSGKRKKATLLTRPNVSNGYWLCCLLPSAFVVNIATANGWQAVEDADAFAKSTYWTLSIAAIGMCVESLCFFAYIYADSWLILKLFISLVPSAFTSILLKTLLHKSWAYGVVLGFAITFCYQNVYMRVLRNLPYCFSYGEAALLVQGVMIFVLNVILHLPDFLVIEQYASGGEFTTLNLIMMSALFYLLIACCLAASFKFLRTPLGFYPLMIVLLLAVTCVPVTQPMPVIALLEFLLKDGNRITITFFYMVLVVLTVLTISWQLQKANNSKATTGVRKIFHGLIVLVYIPGILYQCAFLYIASGVALAIFSVLELFRILSVPPLAEPLKSAFATFSDEKDSGILALTPFSLLIGCSLPIWIHPFPCTCFPANASYLSLLAGVLSIGIGDASASVIGSRWGRIHWRNSPRSLEGSLAFVVSILISVFIICFSGYISLTVQQWLIVFAASLITALIEAHTDQIDNLVLPSVFYAIVSLA